MVVHTTQVSRYADQMTSDDAQCENGSGTEGAVQCEDGSGKEAGSQPSAGLNSC